MDGLQGLSVANRPVAGMLMATTNGMFTTTANGELGCTNFPYVSMGVLVYGLFLRSARKVQKGAAASFEYKSTCILAGLQKMLT